MNRNDQLAFARTLEAVAADFRLAAQMLRKSRPDPFYGASSYAIEAQGVIYDLMVKDRFVMPSDEQKGFKRRDDDQVS